MKRALVVGAGLFGAVMAERLAGAGVAVTVLERRDHIGGHCWSEPDGPTGIERHVYGSHIFHTSDEAVWAYLRRFTDFNDYRHAVWARVGERVVPLPLGLAALNTWYGTHFTPDEARAFLAREAAKEGIRTPRNLEEKAVSLIGRPLYEALIKGYTAKQWQTDPRELSADIISRLPVRATYDIRYFSDRFEGIPREGYGALFARLLAHPAIEVRLNTDFADFSRQGQAEGYDLVCYSGALDAFFHHELGRLEWRTLDFQWERPDTDDFQGTAVMNYPDANVPWTRIHEFRHFHPERPAPRGTLIAREFSRWAGRDDEPYYPVDTEKNRRLCAAYQDMARTRAPQVVFGGRLGAYAYLDMDDAIAAALRAWRDTVAPRLGGGAR